ncbi:MAG: fasciclin domain-containing protein [Ferruginibacter sp.]
MISIKKIKTLGLLLAASITIISCNKDLEQFPDNVNVIPGGLTLSGTIASTPNDSLYNRIIIKSGTAATLNTNATTFTLFVPTNSAVKVFINAASGGLVPLNAPDSVFSKFITNSLPASTAAGIVSYYSIPQAFPTSSFIHPFPNLELPTGIIAVPGNPLARLRIYPSKNPSTGLFYVNNIPLSATDQIVGNSVIHHMAALIPPPQRMVWERLNTDSALTIFKAAIIRADSGFTPITPGSLIGGFQNFGANFTVFTPTNAAMKATLSALTGGAIPPGAPDAVFIGFLGGASISTQTVKGLVVYHLLGSRVASGSPVSSIRAFTVNVPTSPLQVLTFLNNPGPAVNHPGVTLQATFTGPSASAVTVKGLANASASNLIINPTPDLAPSYGLTPPAAPVKFVGTSDQHYINGVLHYIDQVLRPL